MATKTKKQTASPVAAREELDQRTREDQSQERLEEQAKEQEAQQKAELDRKAPGDDDLAAKLVEEGNIAGARRPNSESGNGPVNGFTDQLTRRNGVEPMEGHFVTIDMSADGVLDAYKAAGLTDDDDEVVASAGNYGVYRTVGQRGEDGYPSSIVVRLQDATFTDVTVPYEACRHAASRGITGGS